MQVGSWCPGSINPEDKGGFRGTRFYFKTIVTMADLRMASEIPPVDGNFMTGDLISLQSR